jgi:hypothetical protein
LRAARARYTASVQRSEQQAVRNESVFREGDGWTCIRKGGAAVKMAAETEPRR